MITRGPARTTMVKAQDLKPGMVVHPRTRLLKHEWTVKRVERAAAVADRRVAELARVRTRPDQRRAALGLLEALDAIEFDGDLALMVWYEDVDHPRSYGCADEIPLLRKAPA